MAQVKSKKQKVAVKKNNQNKQNQNKGKGNKGSAGGFSPRKENAWNPNQVLGEKGLKRAVNQSVRRQIRPALKQANRQMGELSQLQTKDVGHEARLGTQATRNVGTYYEQMAQSEAAALEATKASGAALTAGVAGAVGQGSEGIKATGGAVTEGIGAYTDQPIGSRERLAQMVAQQEGAASREGAALNAQAQSQSSGQSALMAGLAGSGQMRGSEQLHDINRQVLNNIAKIRETYGNNISKVQQAKLDLLEKRPELVSQTLMEFRKEQQDYGLSRAALGLKKEEAKNEASGKTGGIAYSNVNTKNQMKILKAKEKARFKEMESQNATQAERDAEGRRFREKEMQFERERSKGNGKGEEGWISAHKAYSILRGNTPKLSEKAEVATNKHVRNAVYDSLVKQGASPKVAKQAIKKLIKQYKKSKGLNSTVGKRIGQKHF